MGCIPCSQKNNQQELQRVDKPRYDIRDVAKDAFNGELEFADAGTVRERRLLCGACPKRIKGVNICSLCGCPIISKIRVAKSYCPIGKWHEIPRAIDTSEAVTETPIEEELQ